MSAGSGTMPPSRRPPPRPAGPGVPQRRHGGVEKPRFGVQRGARRPLGPLLSSARRAARLRVSRAVIAADEEVGDDAEDRHQQDHEQPGEHDARLPVVGDEGRRTHGHGHEGQHRQHRGDGAREVDRHGASRRPGRQWWKVLGCCSRVPWIAIWETSVPRDSAPPPKRAVADATSPTTGEEDAVADGRAHGRGVGPGWSSGLCEMARSGHFTATERHRTVDQVSIPQTL